MVKNKILTIGIPVYNGEKHIEETLISIQNADLGDRFDDVEILISDNKSSDNTMEIVHKYKDDLDLMLYENEENVGYDANIELIVSRAKGDFVWFVGCGERILKDSISEILMLINRNNIDFIKLNFNIYNENDDKLIIRNEHFPEYEFYDTKDDVFYSTDGPGKAVSSNIIRKSAWQSINNEKLKFKNWCHIERIIGIILRDDFRGMIVINKPVFTLLQDKEGWWNSEWVYYNFVIYCSIIKSILFNFNSIIKTRLLREIYPDAFIRSILELRMRKLRINKEFLLLTKNTFGDMRGFNIIMFFYYIIPSFCINKISIRLIRKIMLLFKRVH